MIKLKGKKVFRKHEADTLSTLIKLRVKAERSEQKRIRDKMREIGFYGRDDWGIVNCQLKDFERLISDGSISIK